MRNRRSVSVAAVLTVLAICTVAAASTRATRTTHGDTLPPSVAPRATNRTFVITAHDFAYTALPQRLPAGWVTVRTVNAGSELHMFATASVPRGYTAATLLDSLLHKRGPATLHEWGGPNAVAPGKTGSVTLFLAPGQYIAGCFVVSADGKTHFAKGMMGAFTVVPSRDTGLAPTSTRLAALSTYHIALSGPPIGRGVQTLRVRNDAAAGHDFVILRVLPGHSVADALRWFSNVGTARPAAVPVVGTTALHKGEQVFVTANFTPGTYVAVCWMQTNGKLHYDLGMKHVFTVPAT